MHIANLVSASSSECPGEFDSVASFAENLFSVVPLFQMVRDNDYTLVDSAKYSFVTRPHTEPVAVEIQ